MNTPPSESAATEAPPSKARVFPPQVPLRLETVHCPAGESGVVDRRRHTVGAWTIPDNMDRALWPHRDLGPPDCSHRNRRMRQMIYSRRLAPHASTVATAVEHFAPGRIACQTHEMHRAIWTAGHLGLQPLSGNPFEPDLGSQTSGPSQLKGEGTSKDLHEGKHP